MYQERMATIAEMAENSRFFFEEPAYDAKAVEKHIKNNNGKEYLQQIKALLEPVTDWTATGLDAAMEAMLAIGSDGSGKRGAAAQPLRVAVSGGAVSPPMTETIVLLGREKTLGRIGRALAM
jgi:glutamyl-tRNA synthetase